MFINYYFNTLFNEKVYLNSEILIVKYQREKYL